MEHRKGRKKLDKNNITDIWKLYEDGKNYFDKLNIVNKTTENYRFYEGDHWHGLETGGEKMPIIEIIKPIIDYKTAILTQNKIKAVYTSMNYDATNEERQFLNQICDRLSNHFSIYWENNNMDNTIYDIIQQGGIAGDSYVYLYYNDSNKIKNGHKDSGNVVCELIDNTNIMFSDENERDIQKQEYILVLFRRPIDKIKQEAKINGLKKEEITKIVSDEDTDLQTGYTEEVDGNKKKCLCIMKMWKENNTVHISKSTKTVVYEKDTDLKIQSYPIASFVWEQQKGLCRGVSEVGKYIPNQIWANKLEAYRLISAKLAAFPKLVYSSNLVNKENVDAVGVALEVQANDIQTAMNSVGYINPAPMSSDAKYVMDELMSYTKEAAGAADVATGRKQFDNYSALLAIQESAAAPLSRQTERLKLMLEDVARILYDIWCNYFPNGLYVENDVGQVEYIPNNELKKLKINIKVDITPVTPFNKLTEQQKRDNLLMSNIISFEEYVKILPADEPMKPDLQRIIENRQIQNEQIAAMQQVINEQAGALDQAASDVINLQSQTNDITLAEQEAYNQALIDSAAAKEEV